MYLWWFQALLNHAELQLRTVFCTSRKEGWRRGNNLQFSWVRECRAGPGPGQCSWSHSGVGVAGSQSLSWVGHNSCASSWVASCKQKKVLRRELRGLEFFSKPQKGQKQFSLLGGLVFCPIAFTHFFCSFFSSECYSRNHFDFHFNHAPAWSCLTAVDLLPISGMQRREISE